MSAERRQGPMPPFKPGWLPTWWVWILSRTAFGWSDPDQKKLSGVVAFSVLEFIGLLALARPLMYPGMENSTLLKPGVAVVAAATIALNHLVLFSDARWREFLTYRQARRQAGAARKEIALAAVLLVLYVGVAIVAPTIAKVPS